MEEQSKQTTAFYAITDKMQDRQPLLVNFGIIICPTIVEDDFYSHLTWALTVARMLHPQRPLELRVNGEGGNVNDAMAIVDLIQADGNIDGVLIGAAQSAHSFLWASCNRRYVYPNAYIGIHQTHMQVYESQQFAQTHILYHRQAQWINKRTASIYAAASNRKKKWWYKHLMSADSATVMFDFDDLVNRLGMALPISMRESLGMVFEMTPSVSDEPESGSSTVSLPPITLFGDANMPTDTNLGSEATVPMEQKPVETPDTGTGAGQKEV